MKRYLRLEMGLLWTYPTITGTCSRSVLHQFAFTHPTSGQLEYASAFMHRCVLIWGVFFSCLLRFASLCFASLCFALLCFASLCSSPSRRRGRLAAYEVAFVIRRLQRQPYSHPHALIASPQHHAYLAAQQQQHQPRHTRISSLGIMRGAVGVDTGLPKPYRRLRAVDLRGNGIRKEQQEKIGALCSNKGICVDL